MLFAADITKTQNERLTVDFWNEIGEDLNEKSRRFADDLVLGTLREINSLDDTIRLRAEHWRIERMAVVDRNILRLAVYELLYTDTPGTVVINEALELARQFSTYEATQFINGILDAIKNDFEKNPADGDEKFKKKAQS